MITKVKNILFFINYAKIINLKYLYHKIGNLLYRKEKAREIKNEKISDR